MTAATTLSVRPSASVAARVAPDTTVFVLRSRRRLTIVARVTMVLAIVICGVTIPMIPGSTHTTLGLLFAGVPGVAISIALAGLAFVFALRAGRVRDAWVATIVAVLCMRLPIALGTSAPIYSWTYKHLGVIDWIEHHGHVATGVDIYSGWPGVFAAIAWFCTVTGISATSVAQWFEVGVNLALVVAIGALARALGKSRLTAVTAAFVAGIANWVGQDYLSPQAVSFLLAIVVATMLVRSRTRPVFAWLSLPLFAAIAVSHQLTPYWLIAVAVAFGVIGAARPRLIGVAFGIIAGAMVLANLHLVQEFTTGEALNPVANAETIKAGVGSAGQTLTSFAARLLSVGVWGTAFVLVVVGLRPDRFGGSRIRRWLTLRLAILAFAPFALLAGQSYGGEAIFRVFLYSVPGSTVLIAPLVVRCIRAGRRTSERRVPYRRGQRALVAGAGGAAQGRRARLAVLGGRFALTGSALLVVVASLASAQATYGAWFSNTVSAAADQISTQLLRTMPVPSEVLSPAPAGPGRETEQYVYQARVNPNYDTTLTQWEGWAGQDFTDPRVERKLTEDLMWSGHPVYMMFTDQMIDWAEYNGAFPDGALQRFAKQVANDSRWEVVVVAPGVQLYRLQGTAG